MAKTSIAGALVAVLFTACAVEELEQSPRVLHTLNAHEVERENDAADRTTKTSAFENAGLRSDFKAPC